MSKSDLSTVLAAIQTRNAARVVAALVAIDRWGERVTYEQIGAALEALTDHRIESSAVSRGLATAISDGLIIELRHNGAAFGYRPGRALARAIGVAA